MHSVRPHSLPNAHRPAELAPGEIVWARVVNGIENQLATGKYRPVILVEAAGWAWKTMGLTTRPYHRDGLPRVPVETSPVHGLKSPGWLWGHRLVCISGLDIGDHIGWVDEHLARQVIELAGLVGPAAHSLLSVGHSRIPHQAEGPRR